MLVDDTLREGLQTPGMSYTIEEKIKLSRLIADCGIKRALVSYPSAHWSEVEVTRKICSENIFDETFSLGRTVESDIDKIAETGANISLHLPFQFEDITPILEAVRYAAKKDRILEVSVVNIAKFPVKDLIKLGTKIEEAGADIVQLPDTTGQASPKLIRNVIEEAKRTMNCQISVHCHNDLGGSIANALEGYRSGADIVDTCIYGLGERNGISDTASIAHLIELEGGATGIDYVKLSRAYREVLDLIMRKIGPDLFIDNYPVEGKNTLIHTAGTHAASSKTFQGANYSVNVYTGRSMIAKILESAGIKISRESLSKLTDEIKDLAVSRGTTFSSDEIIKMSREKAD